MGTQVAKRRGSAVQLLPVTPRHYEPLFELIANGELPWQWQGLPPSYESFVSTLWNRTLDQFLVTPLEGGDLVGLVGAYGPSAFHGTAYFHALYRDEYRRKAWPIEGIFLVMDYLFHRYPLRKLYFEIAESRLGQFRSLLSGRLGVVNQEAFFRDHIFVDGGYQSVAVYSVWRDDWFEVAHRLLRQ